MGKSEKEKKKNSRNCWDREQFSYLFFKLSILLYTGLNNVFHISIDFRE